MLKAIILAAGKGTRLKSEKPKVVHEVLGKPMVYYSIEAARAAGCDKVCVIVGYKAEEVEKSIKDTYAKLGKTEEMQDVVSYALQTEQLGTVMRLSVLLILSAQRATLLSFVEIHHL